jgi:hypothetical protein
VLSRLLALGLGSGEARAQAHIVWKRRWQLSSAVTAKLRLFS